MSIDPTNALAALTRVSRLTDRPLGCTPLIGEVLLQVRQIGLRKPKLAAALARRLTDSMRGDVELRKNAEADLRKVGVAVTRAGAVGYQGFVVTASGVGLTWVVGPTDNLESDVIDSNGRKFGTAYTSLVGVIDELAADPACAAIVLAMDTPGGVVTGLRNVRDAMHRAREAGKPVVTLAIGSAASCGCWMHAAASPGGALATPGSCIGYLGVYMTAIDLTEQAAMEGMKVEYLASNVAKLDGSPYMAMTEEARARLMGEVNRLNDQSLEDIAGDRSHAGVSVDSLRTFAETEKYADGARAVEVGLADAVVGGVIEAIGVAERLAGVSADAGETPPMEPPDAQETRLGDAGHQEDSSNRRGCGSGVSTDGAKKPSALSRQPSAKEKTMSLNRESLLKTAEGKNLVETLLAEGRAAGVAEAQAEASKPASFADLKAAGFNADQIVDALDKKMTLNDAMAQRAAADAATIAGLNTKVSELSAKAETAQKALDDKAAGIKALAAAGVSPGRENGVSDSVPGNAKGAAKGKPSHPYLAAIEDYQAEHKCSKTDATKAVARDNPELRAAYLAGPAIAIA